MTEDQNNDKSEENEKKDSPQEPHPEERGVDEQSECPECGEPIENVRMSCPNCGYEYKGEDYTDGDAGKDFRAGQAVDQEGREKDVTGDADVDEEDSGSNSSDGDSSDGGDAS